MPGPEPGAGCRGRHNVVTFRMLPVRPPTFWSLTAAAIGPEIFAIRRPQNADSCDRACLFYASPAGPCQSSFPYLAPVSARLMVPVSSPSTWVLADVVTVTQKSHPALQNRGLHFQSLILFVDFVLAQTSQLSR